MSGNIVELVKKINVKADTPIYSYHYLVKAMLKRLAMHSITRQIKSSVRVSICLSQIEYISIPIIRKTEPTRVSIEYWN